MHPYRARRHRPVSPETALVGTGLLIVGIGIALAAYLPDGTFAPLLALLWP